MRLPRTAITRQACHVVGRGAGVQYDRAMINATMETNKGTIGLELFDDDAPKTVGNFVKLAGDGFYDGVIFHRVIPDFMIQGGDPTGTGMGGPGYQFEDEINPNLIVRGALAMANAGPNTNGSQFFIVTADACPWLDGAHTVFGRVTAGMDVVDEIERSPTDGSDRPIDEVAHRVDHGRFRRDGLTPSWPAGRPRLPRACIASGEDLRPTCGT